MIDEIYKNSFKEVYDILENTEEDLLSKIPDSFMNFIKNNMNVDYKTSINLNETIDKQHLLKETEAILSLIYRSYWATDEEKNEFAKKDNLDFIKEEEQKKEQYQGKDIYKLFEERKNPNRGNKQTQPHQPTRQQNRITKKKPKSTTNNRKRTAEGRPQ